MRIWVSYLNNVYSFWFVYMENIILFNILFFYDYTVDTYYLNICVYVVFIFYYDTIVVRITDDIEIIIVV